MPPDALEKFSIQHAIQGRLRVKVKVWKVSEDQAQALAGWLANQGEVRQVQVHPLSRSIILYYDPGNTSARVVLDLVDRALTLLPTLPPAPSRAASCPVGSEGWWSGLLRVMGLTAFLGYHLAGSLLFGSPLSPGVITLVAVLGGLPLLRDALGDLTQGRVIGLNPFLGSACVLAIATGESLTALEVIWVREVGDTMEQYVADRSHRAIREILEVSTRNTWVWVDGEEVETPVDRVRRGDLVIVPPAEKIPVDGEIVRGEALVDESQITGRSEPELRRAGDAVFAGTIVQQGKLHILAEKVGEQTYLSQVLALVEQSLANRSQAEKRADLLAARLTRLGMAATAATLLLTGNLATAIAVQLVMACPCATVLAASTAVTAALTNAARHRVLIKGGLYLERLGETDCICFDKTGTLTTDVPEVTEIITRSPTLKAGTGPESGGHGRGPQSPSPGPGPGTGGGEAGRLPGPFATPEIVLGRGVRTQVAGDRLVVGNLPFMQEEGIDSGYFQGQADRLEGRGRSVVYVAKNGKVQGIIGISYLVRPGSRRCCPGCAGKGSGKYIWSAGTRNRWSAPWPGGLTSKDRPGPCCPATNAIMWRSWWLQGAR